MNIGECAKIAQCTVETVRYYEKAGLLPEAERGVNNYRIYGSEHVQRLVFIRNCRTLDMSQEEIHTLLQFMDCPERKCGSVNMLVDEHISHVDQRIAELQQLKNDLAALREKCRTESKMRHCRILQGLSAMRPKMPSSRPHAQNRNRLND